MDIEWHNVIGVSGAILYVISYALLQFDHIENDNTYSVLNLAAATMVLVSLLHAFNLASALIQVIWIVISISGLLLRYRERKEPIRLILKNRSKRTCYE